MPEPEAHTPETPTPERAGPEPIESEKRESARLAFMMLPTDDAWEHEERAVYTTEAIEEEYRALVNSKRLNQLEEAAD